MDPPFISEQERGKMTLKLGKLTRVLDRLGLSTDVRERGAPAR